MIRKERARLSEGGGGTGKEEGRRRGKERGRQRKLGWNPLVYKDEPHGGSLCAMSFACPEREYLV